MDGLRCEVVSLGACLDDAQIPGDPEYLYHVTSAPNAARIALMGFKRSPPMFAHGAYPAYSRGGVYLTEQAGLRYWCERVENILMHAHDEPPAVAVVRVPAGVLADHRMDDPVGSGDARQPAWRVALSVCERLWQVSHPDGAVCAVDNHQRPRFNHLDQPIAETEADLRRFWRWFGDSVAVDTAGRPLVLYHGTSSRFTNFAAHEAELGQGVYFTDAVSVAREYGPRVLSAYLALTRPAKLAGDYSDPRYTDSDSAFVSRLHLAQHDSVILAQSEDAPIEYMVTRAEQIRICGETYVALPECGRKTVGLAL